MKNTNNKLTTKNQNTTKKLFRIFALSLLTFATSVSANEKNDTAPDNLVEPIVVIIKIICEVEIWNCPDTATSPEQKEESKEKEKETVKK